MNQNAPNIFSQKSQYYAKFRPRYPNNLYQYLVSLCSTKDVAWDCATGSGQSAISLANYFNSVEATDISSEQLNYAFNHPKITYSVQTAEKTNFAESQFALITVAQALHWFNLEPFWAEVHRVIKPGGIFAAWCYSYSTVSPEIDTMIQELVLDRIENYWLPQNQLIINEYGDVDFPFTLLEPQEAFLIEQSWTINQFFDYLKTWSAMKRYIAEVGDTYIKEAQQEIAKIWQDNVIKSVRMPIGLKVGRII